VPKLKLDPGAIWSTLPAVKSVISTLPDGSRVMPEGAVYEPESEDWVQVPFVWVSLKARASAVSTA
jgi:hypothetical protein